MPLSPYPCGICKAGRYLVPSAAPGPPKLRYTPCARLLPRWGPLASNPLRPYPHAWVFSGRRAAGVGASHPPPAGCRFSRPPYLSAKADSAAPCAIDKRVHGTSNLPVAGASIMPTIRSGNRNAPTTVNAEGAAQILMVCHRGRYPPLARLVNCRCSVTAKASIHARAGHLLSVPTTSATVNVTLLPTSGTSRRFGRAWATVVHDMARDPKFAAEWLVIGYPSSEASLASREDDGYRTARVGRCGAWP